jgi:hypothetical protein
MMTSKLDLNLFERFNIEHQVSLIISQLQTTTKLRRKFYRKGSVISESHANALSPNIPLDVDVQQMNLSDYKRQQSPRLLAQTSRPKSQASSEPVEPAVTFTRSRPCPRADQFCVYNISSKRKCPV